MIPDITGLPLDELRDHDGNVYMRRYYIRRCRPGNSERYHHILTSDPDRDLHDHPWQFTSTILHGEYVETTTTGEHLYGEGDTITREATFAHRLSLTSPVWTHVTTGPYVQTWGFHTDHGWIDWRTYATTYTHTHNNHCHPPPPPPPAPAQTH